MNQQQETPTTLPPFEINCLQITPKNRIDQSLFDSLLRKAFYATEMLQNYEASQYFHKAIQLNPHNVLPFILRGEMNQFIDSKKAINDFEHAIDLCTKYPNEQEFPTGVSSHEEKQISLNQYKSLCRALICDTIGKYDEAKELLIEAIKLREKYATDESDSEQFNNEIQRIDREEDDFIMSYLYLYLNYVQQRNRLSMKDMTKNVMKALVYGPRHSCIMPYFEILRFSGCSPDILCVDRLKFLDDARAIDEKRCFLGLTFYVSDMLSEDKRDEVQPILEYFLNKYKACAYLYSLLGRCLITIDPERSKKAIEKAFELEPCLDTFLQLKEIDNNYSETYLKEIEASRQYALTKVISDLQARKIVGYTRFAEFLYEINQAASNGTGTYIELIASWNNAFHQFQRRDFDMFYTFEERVCPPESKYSTRVKSTLNQTRKTLKLYSDCDIICTPE